MSSKKTEKSIELELISGNRILYPDLLRVFAVFAVIVIHVSASGFYSLPITSFEWKIVNLYGSAARWAVPIFVMVSGIFFLNPQRKVYASKLYRKKIFRIFTALVFWGLLYRSVDIVKLIVLQNADFTTVVSAMFRSYSHVLFGTAWYHLWFLYMIIGLYMIVPLLRVFTKNAALKHYNYFFLLFVIFGSAIPLLSDSLALMNRRYEINFKIPELMGFVSYFILGFYLSINDLPRRIRCWLYAFALASVFLQVVGTLFVSSQFGVAHDLLYGFFRPNVVIPSIAVFVFIKELSKRNFSKRARMAIYVLSKYSFGMYLVHDVFNMFFQKVGFTITCISPALAIPLRSLATFGLSFLAIWGLSKIPVLNKYCM